MNNIFLAINFEYIFLDFYKQLCLEESEVVVVLMINHLIKQGNLLITADLLAIKMNLEINFIDNILVKMIKKGYLKYVKDKDGNLFTTLKPLEEKLYQLYQLEINKDTNKKFNEETLKITKNIYEVFEKELGRTLSPVEFSLIDEWIANGISEEECIDALHEAINKNKTSLKFIDKILLQWQTRNDLEIDGYSAISDSWKKNIDQTINFVNKKINNDSNDFK